MKKVLGLSAAVLATGALLVGTTVTTNTAEAGRRGAAIGLGIVAGVATAAILSDSARAERRYYRRDRYRHSCGQLAYRCDHGSDWACDRFYDRGC
jgi:hypothetical protein